MLGQTFPKLTERIEEKRTWQRSYDSKEKSEDRMKEINNCIGLYHKIDA